MKTFSQKVVEAAMSIPEGKVSTYGDIAKAAGGRGQAARSVNGILVKARNNDGKSIPFHRIVYANGKIWKNKKYDEARKQMFNDEGIGVTEKGYVVDFFSKRYRF